jgi:hypothetical protein
MSPEVEARSEDPKHSAAFGQFREASGATTPEDQERARTAQAQVDHLMQVSPEELVLLHQVGIAGIETEMARRSLEATNANTAALVQLQTSIDSLKAATGRWSRWLTGLTVAVAACTVVLVGITITLVLLTVAQVVLTIVVAHR